MTFTRRDLLRAAAALPVLAACGKDEPAPPRPSPQGAVPLQEVGGEAAPVLDIADAESELVQGTSRYAFGLIGEDGPISGAKATVYFGADPERPPEGTVPATELVEQGINGRGLYVTSIPFPNAGQYYVAVVADTAQGALKGGTIVEVAASSKSPAPGKKVPSVATPTTKDPRGADPLCSRRPKPCTMHAISLDDALRNGKPTVIVFAAPAFCQTEMCGPGVEITQGAATKFAGKANFIHVEAFRGATKPGTGTFASALAAFKFDTEPWLYVVDAKGVVSDRISGAFAAGELTDRLAKVGVR